jgi:hypothetical protein
LTLKIQYPKTAGEDRIETYLAGNDLQILFEQGLQMEYLINGRRVSGSQFTVSELRERTDAGADGRIAVSVLRNGLEIYRQTHRIVLVGTSMERFIDTPEENAVLQGDLAEAHKYEDYVDQEISH